MKRDDIKNILGEGASEEQITNLLNAVHNSSKEAKNKIDELNAKLSDYDAKLSDYDDIKKKLDDINKANMSEQEKLEADKKLTAETLKKAQIIYNTAKVKEILSGENVDENLISNLVSDNAEVSIANANALKQTLTNLKDSVEKKTRESLATANLKPSITNVNQGEDAMTFETFAQLSAEAQEKFIAEHPDEFDKL